MTLIGYLHTRKDPAKVKKLYAFQAVAKAEGAELVYFTAGMIRLRKRRIKGYVYENGSWIRRLCPYPDVIYNDSYPSSPKRELAVERLREEIPFTSYPIGSKYAVYHRILEGGLYADSLIPSIELQHPQEVFDRLARSGRLILKPSWGHQGLGVALIEAAPQGFIWKERGKQESLTRSEIEQRLEELLAGDDTFLIQSFIVTKTRSGHAYDFRLHVQKDGGGRWAMSAIYPRIAKEGEFIANLSAGGYSQIPTVFFREQFGAESADVEAQLTEYALGLAAHLDEVCGKSFDELGIDVALDGQGRIHLFEVNWKPGVPVTFYMELDVARRSIQYCMYLANNN